MNVLIHGVTFIRMSRRGHGGGRRGRPRQQHVALLDEILAQEEGVGQANMDKPVS